MTLRKVHSLTSEVSSACNLRCAFCPVGNKKIEPRLMDLKDHHKIIDLLPKSIKKIRYSYRDDATLNKEFVKMIKYAASKGFNTTLSTRSKKLLFGL